MAINFPNSPISGNTYDYQGVRYTYLNGYWSVVTPNQAGVATSPEIITGTDSLKYVTPAGLEGSDYWNARNVGPASGLDSDTVDGLHGSQLMRSDADAHTTGNLSGNTLTYDKAINISGEDLDMLITPGFYNGSGMNGQPSGNGWWYVTVQKYSTNNFYATQRATSFEDEVTYERELVGVTWSDWREVWTSKNAEAQLNSHDGYQVLPSGLITKWGSKIGIDIDGSFYTINFPTPFPSKCYNVQLTWLKTGSVVGTATPRLNYLDEDMFQFTMERSVDSMNYINATGGNVYWTAIGE